MFDFGIVKITKVVEGPYSIFYHLLFACDCDLWTRYPESAYLCGIHLKWFRGLFNAKLIREYDALLTQVQELKRAVNKQTSAIMTLHDRIW